MNGNFQIEANVVDIGARSVNPSVVTVVDGRIESIEAVETDCETYLIPGFVDSHVHIESSMLVPSEFAKVAVCHGTVATVSDPHEIGNVVGIAGVEFMLENAATVPFKFCFGAPACVPATRFETSGATISVEEVESLLADDRIGYLSEVMDFPAVLRRDPDIMQKIAAAHAHGKIADGHAPGLRGAEAANYFAAGIATDHECFTKAEALDKIAVGCQIAIREGSAARNFEALFELIDEYPDQVMLCSDDKHPDELVHGHLDQLVRRSVKLGLDVFNILQVACVNPVELYSLPVGQLRVGDTADFLEIDNLSQFNVLRTFINGQVVADRGNSLIATRRAKAINNFDCKPRPFTEFSVQAISDSINVIQATDGQLITQKIVAEPKVVEGQAVADPERDILKIVLVNRYHEAPVSIGFVQGFGITRGALASSVAHDSHNIVAVGIDDHAIARAINLVIENQGGLAVADSQNDRAQVLALPVAGLMSLDSAEEVAAQYTSLDQQVKQMGSTLRAPFMTLSFMALLVIPELKLSDRGLFDGQQFEFTRLFN